MNKFKFLSVGFLSVILGSTIAVGTTISKPFTGAKAEGQPETLYLIASTTWNQDNPRYAAYFFGNGDTWVSMDDSDGDGIYEVDIPTTKTYPSVIFSRMNPGTTTNNWDNKWNQTDDLTIPTNGDNCYTVKEGTWDKGGGTWSSVGTEYEYNLVAELIGKKLFLKPSNSWNTDNPRYAAYFFGNGDTWVSMDDSDGDGIYEVDIPTTKTYPSVIFCRMNPGTPTNNWDNRWNQTDNLTIPTDGKNCYTVKEGTWDKGGGTWSQCTLKYYFHLYKDGTTVGYKWKTKEATATDIVYNGMEGDRLVVLNVKSIAQFDKVILATSISFNDNTYDGFESESKFDIDGPENNEHNIFGATIVSDSYDVTKATKDENSKDKTLAYTFLKKFYQLGRIEGDVCDAVEANMDLYYECAAIYNSFNHATYVDSINDAIYDEEQKTIKDTMEWLKTKYGIEPPNEGVNAKQNVLFLNTTIGDSNIIIVALVAVSLIGVAALVIAKRKRLQK